MALSPGSFTEHRLAIGSRAWALWPLVAGRTPVTMAVSAAAARPGRGLDAGARGRLGRAAAAAGPEPTMDDEEGDGS